MPQETFESMDSDKLMAILKEHDMSSYSEEDFEHIEKRLADRGFYVSEKKFVEKKDLTGINGWLVLPAIGLVAATVMALVMMIMDLDYMAQFSRYQSVFATELVFNAIIMISAIIAAIFFFTKNKLAPKVFITFLVINLLLMLFDATMAIDAFGSRVEDEAYGGVARAMIAAAVWIPYFIMSKRVKNTFVN